MGLIRRNDQHCWSLHYGRLRGHLWGPGILVHGAVQTQEGEVFALMNLQSW